MSHLCNDDLQIFFFPSLFFPSCQSFISVSSLKGGEFICEIHWMPQLLLQSIFKILSMLRAEFLNFNLQGVPMGFIFFFFCQKASSYHRHFRALLMTAQTGRLYTLWTLVHLLEVNRNILLVCLCFQPPHPPHPFLPSSCFNYVRLQRCCNIMI